jgi:hypothetical protein
MMKSSETDPKEKQDKNLEDASETNKTDENGAFIDNGKSKNYKGGDDPVNGPNYDEESEAADGDTSSTAGVFK